MAKKTQTVIIHNQTEFGAKYPHLMKPDHGKILAAIRAGWPVDGVTIQDAKKTD